MATNRGIPKQYIILVAFFVVIVVLRMTIITGEKFLKGVHPWDYIAMIVSTVLALLLIYRYREHLT